MAALGKNHYSNAGTKETGAFSVNIPPPRWPMVIDYCGIVSGKKIDQSTVFEIFYGKAGKAPMIEECLFNDKGP